MIDTQPLRVRARDESSQLPQYFSIAFSFWAMVLAVRSWAVPRLTHPEGLSRVRTHTVKAYLESASNAAGEAVNDVWSAIEIVAHTARLLTGGVARTALVSLGFDHARDSKAAAWRVLKHPQFRLFFVGSFISNWGTWLQNAAQVLLAYRFSHSVLIVGLITCAQFSTPFILAPWASIFADRIGARRTLVITQLVSALVTALMAILQFAQLLSEASLFGAAFMVGLMFTFALPAQSALIPALVPDDRADTKTAVIMNSVSYNAGRMVAPAFTVLIVVLTGFWCAFALNAVTFIIFVGILSRLRPVAPVPMTQKSRVRDGVRIVREDRKILVLLLCVAAVTLAEDPILVLGPWLARHTFHIPYDCSGYFLCALGAGAVLSALLPRRRSPSTRRSAAALGLLGFSIVIFVSAPWMWLSVAAAFSAGLWGLVAGSAAQAMLRQLAGRERALQVMGLWAVAWAGSKPFASLLDGLLPSLIGVQLTGIAMAIPALLPPLVLILMPDAARRITKKRSAELPREPHLSHSFTPTTGGNYAA